MSEHKRNQCHSTYDHPVPYNHHGIHANGFRKIPVKPLQQNGHMHLNVCRSIT
ncbi:MAG: hypothetical protein R2847_12880 [Bacteroidia bacterium]